MIHTLLCYESVNALSVVLDFFFLLVRWHIAFDYLLSELVGRLVKCFKLVPMRGMDRPLGSIGGNTLICKCMERLNGNAVSFVCLVKSKMIGIQTPVALALG